MMQVIVMNRSIPFAGRQYFVQNKNMAAETYSDTGVCGIAAAIGEPARARMLYCLMDGHARTSTELAIVAEVSPSTASVHLPPVKYRRSCKSSPSGKAIVITV